MRLAGCGSVSRSQPMQVTRITTRVLRFRFWPNHSRRTCREWPRRHDRRGTTRLACPGTVPLQSQYMRVTLRHFVAKAGLTMVAALSKPCIVRQGTESLQIEVLHGSKRRTLERPAQEALERSLSRLQKALGSPPTLIDAHGEAISADTPAADAWALAAVLRAGGDEVFVLFDPPEVTTIECPSAPHVGIPLRPLLGLRFCEPAAASLTWERCRGGTWEQIGSNLLSYTPSEADLDAELRVRAMAPLSAPVVGADRVLERTLDLGVVRRPPERPILERRVRSLNGAVGGADFAGGNSGGSSPERLRLMCYNLSAPVS